MLTHFNNEDGGTIRGTVSTTDATVTTVLTVDNLTDDSAHMIEVFTTAEQDSNASGGIWKHVLYVTKRSGVVVIEDETTIVTADDGGSSLKPTSVTFAVSGGDMDINVEGDAATNYKWNCTYIITQKTTN